MEEGARRGEVDRCCLVGEVGPGWKGGARREKKVDGRGLVGGVVPRGERNVEGWGLVGGAGRGGPGWKSGA